MSDDENLVLLFSLAVAAWYGVQWYRRAFASSLAPPPADVGLLMQLAPLAALIGILIVLKNASSHDVREAPIYIALYAALGAAWTLGATALFSTLGISFRDDAIERRNPAAAVAVSSALLAHAAIYAGGNIGDGPGWWVVVSAATLGAGAWFLLWLVIEWQCAASELITVERDLSAAVRLGGYMIASGIIFGRSVAGDWISFEGMVLDFGMAWPAVACAGAVIAIERALRGRAPAGMRASAGIALGYVAVAIAMVALSPRLV